MIFEDFNTLIDEIIKCSKCMQYSPETKESILKLFDYKCDDECYQSKLKEWGDYFYQDDFQYLCKYKEVKLIINVIQKIQNFFNPLDPESDESDTKAIIKIYMTYRYKELNALIADVQSLVNLELLNDQYIIDRDLNGDYSTGPNFKIHNPYDYLYQFQSKLVDYVSSSIDGIIPTDDFTFSNDFKIIPQLLADIEDADFDKDDHDKLKSECCLIILKGFLFNQVCYKLNDEGIQWWKDSYSKVDKTNFTDDEIQKDYELNCLKYKSYNLSLNLDEINEKKINEIYQKYSDSKKNVVKKFITELIPNYKKYLNPEKLIKLIYEMTEKYQIYYYHFDLQPPYVINFLYQYLPVKLIDSPNDFYDKIFNEIYICSSNWFFTCILIKTILTFHKK